MTHCVFTRLADRDLEEIADYIARDNPVRAVSFIRELRTRCDRLTDQPLAFPLRPEFGEGVHLLPYGRYLIFYTLRDDSIRIERVFCTAREILPICEHGRGSSATRVPLWWPLSSLWAPGTVWKNPAGSPRTSALIEVIKPGAYLGEAFRIAARELGLPPSMASPNGRASLV